MEQIFFPKNLLTLQETLETIAQINLMIKQNPEAENDYILIDKFDNGDINIKFMKKEVVDELCGEYNITPYDVCMAQMRKQNYDLMKN